MIIIVTNQATASEKIDYVFADFDAKDRERIAKPTILSGDRELLDLVVETSRFTHKYLSVVFSWGEPLATIGDQNIKNVVEEFSSLLTAGLPIDDFCRLAVLHQRSHGCDVHLFLAKTHLPTGLQFPFFCYTRDDCDLIRTFQQVSNGKYGWPDPSEIRRQKWESPIPRGLSKDERDIFQSIDLRAAEYVASPHVKNRDHLLSLFAEARLNLSADNYGVTFTYVKKTLRFSGKKFGENEDYEKLRRDAEARRDPTSNDHKARLAAADQKLAKLKLARETRLQKRFAGRGFSINCPGKSGHDPTTTSLDREAPANADISQHINDAGHTTSGDQTGISHDHEIDPAHLDNGQLLRLRVPDRAHPFPPDGSIGGGEPDRSTISELPRAEISAADPNASGSSRGGPIETPHIGPSKPARVEQRTDTREDGSGSIPIPSTGHPQRANLELLDNFGDEKINHINHHENTIRRLGIFNECVGTALQEYIQLSTPSERTARKIAEGLFEFVSNCQGHQGNAGPTRTTDGKLSDGSRNPDGKSDISNDKGELARAHQTFEQAIDAFRKTMIFLESLRPPPAPEIEERSPWSLGFRGVASCPMPENLNHDHGLTH